MDERKDAGDTGAGSFLSRWSRRKEQVRSGDAVAPEPVVAPVVPAVAANPPPIATPAEPLPTMADVALLTRESDYARFVGAGVDEGVKRAAMKKLFADPHFNIMDGLDTYIDDYGKADPIPLAMLRQLNQSKFLRLFEDDEEKQAPDATEPPSAPDDDPDLRLQQDDAAGRPGPDQGPGA